MLDYFLWALLIFAGGFTLFVLLAEWLLPDDRDG